MEPDIPEILRSTATNMSELFNMLARKVEMLKQENLKMREELAILKNEKHQ